MRTRAVGPLLVVGDAILERDLDGCAIGLVPGTAAPILDDPVGEALPGGAALTALLAARAGCEVVLVAPLGPGDPASVQLRRLIEPHVKVVPLPLDGTLGERIRIRADGRTLVRIDRGGGACGSPGPEVLEALRSAGTIIVSDHGRGTATQPRLRTLLAERAQCVRLVWDPYPDAAPPVPGTLLTTPELGEVSSGLGGRPSTAPQLIERATLVARRLLREWDSAGICLTLGGHGALLAFNGDNPLIVPARPVPAGDPCGAGESFAAALAVALHLGALPSEAVATAVSDASSYLAAGGPAALAADLAAGPLEPAAGRPAELRPAARAGSVRAALAAVAEARAGGATIVATGGCFDVLHAGHLACLKAARELGDFLVVCVNSDASVRRLKGRGHPVNKAADRAALLAELDCVDAVAVFGEDDARALLDRIRPDLWIKGGDYAGVGQPEADLLSTWGGRVAAVPYLDRRAVVRPALA